MRYFLTFALLFVSCTLFAQNSILMPVTPEQEISSKLFSLQGETNHHFSIGLKDNNFLLVAFNRLSDWRDTGAFRLVMRQAASIAHRMQDSFGSPLNSRHLQIHLPIKNTPITARMQSNSSNAGIVVLNDQDHAPLKIGMDTITVLKTLGERRSEDSDEKEKKEKAQVQYTFLLKDLSQIEALAADEEWIAHTSALIDSIVNTYRRRWRNQDLWYHNLYVSYRPEETAGKRLVVNHRMANEETQGLRKALNLDYGMGISLVRHTLAPNADVGITYIFEHDKSENAFARISMNSLFLFGRDASNNIKSYGMAFANIEAGATVGNSYPLPFHLISLGFGVKINSRNTHPDYDRDWYKFYFRYGVTKAIILSPEFYLTPKKQEQNWMGFSLSLRLF